MQEEKRGRRLRLVYLAPFVVVLALCIGGIASVFADVSNSYNFDSGLGGVVLSGASLDTTAADCDAGSAGCVTVNAGTPAVLTSPLITAPADLGNGVSGANVSGSVRIDTNGGNSATVTGVTLHVVSGTDLPLTLGSCTNSASLAYSTCAFTGTAPTTVRGATVQLVVNVSESGAGGVGHVDTLSYSLLGSSGGAVGSMAYPPLDLASISANMGAYFAFIAPALWIVAGIGLGGLIVGKVRHLF